MARAEAQTEKPRGDSELKLTFAAIFLVAAIWIMRAIAQEDKVEEEALRRRLFGE